MKEDQEQPRQLFVIANTHFGTRIGGISINPSEAPKAVSEEFYNAYRREFDHYTNKGTISVTKPTDKRYSGMEKRFNAAEELKGKEVAGGNLPPPPIKIQGSLPFAPQPNKKQADDGVVVNVVKTTEEIMNVQAEDAVCVALTSSGSRCKNNKIVGKSICGIHLRNFNNGKEIETYLGDVLDDSIVNDVTYQ